MVLIFILNMNRTSNLVCTVKDTVLDFDIPRCIDFTHLIKKFCVF